MIHPNQSKRCTLPEYFGAVIDFYDHFYAHGKAKKPTLAQSALKMIEEAGEFAGKVSKSRPKIEQEDEWADTLFALLHTAVVADYEITKAMARVAEKNYDKFDSAIVIEGIIVKKSDQPQEPQEPQETFIDRDPKPAPTNPPGELERWSKVSKKWWQIWK